MAGPSSTHPQPAVGLPPRVREAKAAGYREFLLDVAEAEFARDGYDAALMKGIAARAAVSLTTLYHHFPTKMELYRAVHARRLAQLAAELAAAVPAGSDPLSRMLAAMQVYVRFHMTHPEWLGMHLREGNAWSGDAQLRSPEQTAAWRRGVTAMARTFREGIAEGWFVDDDPLLLAHTTNALHQVALARWVDQGRREGAPAVVRRLQQRFVRAFCPPERVPALLEAHGLGGAT